MLGFKFLHIWAHPPAKGDDYIFYNHTKDQLIPTKDDQIEW